MHMLTAFVFCSTYSPSRGWPLVGTCGFIMLLKVWMALVRKWIVASMVGMGNEFKYVSKIASKKSS